MQSVQFFPLPEKLHRDYKRNYDLVTQSIIDKNQWRPLNHINPIVKGGLENFFPSLQPTSVNQNIITDIPNPPISSNFNWSTPTSLQQTQQPTSLSYPQEISSTEPEDPYWHGKFDNVLHQIEKEIPEKTKFKDTFSHNVLPELTSSVPLYEKGENYYGSDRELINKLKELEQEAKAHSSFEQTLSQISTGAIPKLHHLEVSDQHIWNPYPNKQQFKLSEDEINDIRLNIRELGLCLDWRIAFQGVMKQLKSHVPRFGIQDISEMPTNEEEARIWRDQQNNYKQTFDRAMQLIKQGKTSGAPYTRTPYTASPYDRFNYGGQQYLYQKQKPWTAATGKPITAEATTVPNPLISNTAAPMPTVAHEPVYHFVEIKSDEGSKFMDIKASNTIPIMPLTYKTYETFQPATQPAVTQEPQKIPLVTSVETNTEPPKEKFSQKVKDVFKKLANKSNADKTV